MTTSPSAEVETGGVLEEAAVASIPPEIGVGMGGSPSSRPPFDLVQVEVEPRMGARPDDALELEFGEGAEPDPKQSLDELELGEVSATGTEPCPPKLADETGGARGASPEPEQIVTSGSTAGIEADDVGRDIVQEMGRWKGACERRGLGKAHGKGERGVF